MSHKGSLSHHVLTGQKHPAAKTGSSPETAAALTSDANLLSALTFILFPIFSLAAELIYLGSVWRFQPHVGMKMHFGLVK